MGFLVPLRSTTIVNGNNGQGLLNPALRSSLGPASLFVNSDVMFRDGFDGLQNALDVCTLADTSGC